MSTQTQPPYCSPCLVRKRVKVKGVHLVGDEYFCRTCFRGEDEPEAPSDGTRYSGKIHNAMRRLKAGAKEVTIYCEEADVAAMQRCAHNIAHRNYGLQLRTMTTSPGEVTIKALGRYSRRK